MASTTGVGQRSTERSMSERYSQALKENPIRTKAATSFILSGMSALISKLHQNGGVFNGEILGTAFRMALLSCPPYSHFWYPILDSISKNAVVKTFIDQIFWRPLIIAYSFVLMNLLKGKSWKQIGEILSQKLFPTIKAGWRIWPAAQFLNQLVVPLHLRTVSMDVVAFFWDMYLTVAISSDATPGEDEEGNAGEGAYLPDTLIQASLEAELRALVAEKGCGPILIRLSWHDAGVYSTGKLTGGCPNAAMRFTDGGEGTFGANAGLPTVALKLLQPITNKYVGHLKAISHADLWTLAANVAIEHMGGPKIPTRFGRKDAASSAESVKSQVGRLPDGDKGASHLLEIFGPKGFDARDIVALSGAHTVGSCHADRSGFEGPWTEQPLKFDNTYFTEMLAKSESGAYAAETTAAGNPQFRDASTGTMMLISDLALLEEPFRSYVEEFAASEEAFFEAFSSAWVKLQENGVNTHLRMGL